MDLCKGRDGLGEAPTEFPFGDTGETASPPDIRGTTSASSSLSEFSRICAALGLPVSGSWSPGGFSFLLLSSSSAVNCDSCASTSHGGCLAFVTFCWRLRNQANAAMRPRPSTAAGTPIPIPTFVPVDMEEDGEEEGCASTINVWVGLFEVEVIESVGRSVPEWTMVNRVESVLPLGSGIEKLVGAPVI